MEVAAPADVPLDQRLRLARPQRVALLVVPRAAVGQPRAVARRVGPLGADAGAGPQHVLDDAEVDARARREGRARAGLGAPFLRRAAFGGDAAVDAAAFEFGPGRLVRRGGDVELMNPNVSIFFFE